jgi:hypothetical protein
MIVQTHPYVAENECDDRLFILSLKEEYEHNLSLFSMSYKDHLPDVVKLDFERLVDFIRFEALKHHKFLTIDHIKEALFGTNKQ